MGPRSLPLWLADPDWQGFAARSGARARAAGLTHRPLEDTLRDVLAWEEQQPGHPHGAGLADGEERALLRLLAER
jgi:2'-hydroxyisoflavone reductase